MTITAVLLVLLSAFIHAGWNVLGKKHTADSAFYCVAATAAVFMMVPLVVLWWETFTNMPLRPWLYLLPTGFFQAVYFLGLSSAYDRGDLAVAYPVVRALPVLIVPLIAHIFNIGSPSSATSWAGIGLVTAGLTIHAFHSGGWFPHSRRTDVRQSWLVFAVLAGIGTAGYSVVDDMALRAFRTTMSVSAPSSIVPYALSVKVPLLYATFQSLATVLFLTLWGVVTEGVTSFRDHLRNVPITPAAGTGVAVVAAYSLVLMAYGFADNAGYVVAFRQINLPVGLLMAILILKERLTLSRVIGSLLILSGLVAVATG